MENKYYIPQIEEFRVGFEYEYEVDSEDLEESIWKKAIFDFDFGWIEFPNTFNEDKRVKYLNSEDVESLGFICILDDVGIQHYRKGNFILKTDYDLGSYIDGDFNLYSIIHNPYDGQYNNVFSGIIKNKSELKVLLKQLGIK